MKISPSTISILQNFQSINPSIILDKGNVLRTISPVDSIFAKAELVDEFPRQAGIYSLTKFLGILSLNGDSEVEFLDKYILITQGKSKIKYSYCAPEMIKSPPASDIELPSKDISFDLSAEILQKLIKAMSILGFSEIAI